jgi:Ca2+-transporting ATPase
VLSRLDSDPAGLATADADARLLEHGPNRIAVDDRLRAGRIILHQFASPLVYVLLAALVVTLLLRHQADAVVIALVLLLNACVGFVQEYRAENAMQALRSMIAPVATVRRAGERLEIPGERLVPGDIVLLESGSVVPADVRLLHGLGVQVNEAVITGESAPVAKQHGPLPAQVETPLPERRNMLLMGSAVVSGRATAVVVATGAATEIGAVATTMRETRRAETPLQQRMKRFAGRLTIAVVVASALALAIGVVRGEPMSAMFLTAVAIAVSAMPEGLPVVMTIALAVSVRRMARRNAVIRRLPAVETLGSCTVIVTDKTGTLTENRMSVAAVWSDGRRYAVTGASLGETGQLESDGAAVELDPDSPPALTLLAGMLDNESDVRHEPGGQPSSIGDPTEVALLIAARKAGFDRERLLEAYPIIDAVPFESERQFSATVHRHDGDEQVFVKGAPERVVPMCESVRTATGAEPIDRDLLLDAAQQLAAEGHRVLAMARGTGADAVASLHAEPSGLEFLGLVGMIDPPRAAVPGALERCRAAGIRVLMLTGDHASTAEAVARQTGLVPADQADVPVHTGTEIAGLSDDALVDLLRRDVVYARTTPDQKLRIVTLLRDAGEVVAVTGDGVNDAPALKAAHLGAAMGRTGTDVAREASEMVLTDDDFATVYAAVEEGRVAFANLRKASFFLISSGAADLITILASLAMGMPLPFLPAQILWMNVVTNGIQDVALAFEPGEPHLFREPPRPLREGVLSRLLVARTVLVGAVMAVCTLVVFALEHARTGDLAYAQVAAVTAMVVFQVVHVGSCRSETASVFRRSVFSNPFLLIGSASALGVHLLAMSTPWTQYLLRLEPLEARTWAMIAALAAPIVLVVEVHKLVLRRRPAASE